MTNLIHAINDTFQKLVAVVTKRLFTRSKVTTYPNNTHTEESVSSFKPPTIPSTTGPELYSDSTGRCALWTLWQDVEFATPVVLSPIIDGVDLKWSGGLPALAITRQVDGKLVGFVAFYPTEEVPNVTITDVPVTLDYSLGQENLTYVEIKAAEALYYLNIANNCEILLLATNNEVNEWIARSSRDISLICNIAKEECIIQKVVGTLPTYLKTLGDIYRIASPSGLLVYYTTYIPTYVNADGDLATTYCGGVISIGNTAIVF